MPRQLRHYPRTTIEAHVDDSSSDISRGDISRDDASPRVTRPLRVIQVVNVRWFNATAWYGLFLSSLLRDAGHEVRVICPAGTESFNKARDMGFEPLAVDLNSGNPFSAIGAYRQLRRLVRDFRPHIVNCHRGESFFLWGMLKQSGGFGLVRTRGDQRPPRGNFPNKLLHGTVADAVIATSSGIADAVRNTLHVPENRVHTIFGGGDTRRFYPDAEGRAAMRAMWGIGPETRTIGLVGRFDAVKGQKELIAAYAALLRHKGDGASAMADTRLVLAGFGTTALGEEQVRGWARAAGIAGRVIFPGRCESVRALMNALDLGVVASLGSETIARVALEIMACGVPLVGTRVGVMPDLLYGDALVPPGDEAALEAILRRFLAEPAFGDSLRAAQGERMRTLSERDFLEQTLGVYRDAAPGELF